MTLFEKAFTLVVIAAAGLILVGVISVFQLAFVVRFPNVDPAPLQLAWFVAAVIAVTMLSTAIVNRMNDRLGYVATIIQTICLCLTIYGIPIGIWGFVLIAAKQKRDQSNRGATFASDISAPPESCNQK